MNEILYQLSRHCVNIMNGWLPFPATAFLSVNGGSLYQIRKELKQLKDKGLIESVHYCQVTDNGNFIRNGYTITKAGKYTEEYKTAYAEGRKLCLETFQIDIGSYESHLQEENQV